MNSMASKKRKLDNPTTFKISSDQWIFHKSDLDKNKIFRDDVTVVPNLPTVKYHFEFHKKLLENSHIILFMDIPLNMNIAVHAHFRRGSKLVGEWTYCFTKSDEKYSKVCSYDVLEKMFEAKSCLWFCVEATLTLFTVDDLFSNIIKIDNLGTKLWKNESSKDAKIVVHGMEIRVNKCVLQSCSTLFNYLREVKAEPGMPSGAAAAATPQIKYDAIAIDNYMHKIVEKAVMFCYDIPCFDNLSAEEAVNLFKFAEEYQMKDLKEKTEDFCIEILAPANACFFANISSQIVAEKLYHKSFDFLLKCMKDGTAVKDIEKLNPQMKEKIFVKAFNKA